MPINGKIIISQVIHEDDKWKNDLQALLKKDPSQDIKQTSKHLHAFFAAYLDKLMVGHSVILKSNHTGMWILDSLFVNPDFRKKGLAKELTKLRIDFARKHGASEIWYCCADTNIASMQSHINHDFEKIRPATQEETRVPSHWYRFKLK